MTWENLDLEGWIVSYFLFPQSLSAYLIKNITFPSNAALHQHVILEARLIKSRHVDIMLHENKVVLFFSTLLFFLFSFFSFLGMKTVVSSLCVSKIMILLYDLLHFPKLG